MLDILIYLLDKKYEAEVRALFPGEHYRPYIAASMEEILEICQQELFDLALIWPATYDETADFLTILNINYISFMPVIAVLEDSSQLDRMLTLPIIDYMKLPLPREEFFQILSNAADDAELSSSEMDGVTWRGILEEYGLKDLIQMITDSRLDAHITLKFNDKIGHVFFKNGDIVRVRYLGLTGMSALKKLSVWKTGNFSVSFAPQDHSAAEPLNATKAYEALSLHLSELHKYFRGLPSLDDEIMTNPMTASEGRGPLHQKIIDICQSPIRMFDLLQLLDDDDIAIAKALKDLFVDGTIGSREAIESIIEEESQKKSWSKLSSTFSSLFKKKELENLPLEPVHEEEVEEIVPTLKIEKEAIAPEVFRKIQTRLKEWYP